MSMPATEVSGICLRGSWLGSRVWRVGFRDYGLTLRALGLELEGERAKHA